MIGEPVPEKLIQVSLGSLIKQPTNNKDLKELDNVYNLEQSLNSGYSQELGIGLAKPWLVGYENQYQEQLLQPA